MAGSRDDGTVAEDKAYSKERRVARAAVLDRIWSRRAQRSNDETLDPWAPEDVAEQQYWQRAQKNINLGYPEDYDGSRGY